MELVCVSYVKGVEDDLVSFHVTGIIGLEIFHHLSWDAIQLHLEIINKFWLFFSFDGYCGKEIIKSCSFSDYLNHFS